MTRTTSPIPNNFLGRGVSCRCIFVSWWLVVGRGGLWQVVVARGRSWWLVVARVLF